jgi:hypothetical protein
LLTVALRTTGWFIVLVSMMDSHNAHKNNSISKLRKCLRTPKINVLYYRCHGVGVFCFPGLMCWRIGSLSVVMLKGGRTFKRWIQKLGTVVQTSGPSYSGD